jgi:hypothetical protein
VLTALVRAGRAPRSATLADQLGIPAEEARAALADLAATGVPAIWLAEDREVASFAPFSNFPTHHEISVRGERKWYGQ